MGKYQYHYRPKTKAQARAERELRAREKKFTEEHKNDTDEELMEYLKGTAAAHEGPLFKADIPGGELIGKRFGGWLEALKLAGLEAPTERRPVIGYTREQQKKMMEAQRQREILRQKMMKNQSSQGNESTSCSE